MKSVNYSKPGYTRINFSTNTKTHSVGNPGPGLGQAQTCGGLYKLVNGISNTDIRNNKRPHVIVDIGGIVNYHCFNFLFI
jgi:hypothetical protein